MSRLIAFVSCLLLATSALAGGGRDSFDSAAYGGYGLTNATTNSLIRQLKRDFQRCSSIPWTYRYDCYDDAYYRSARNLSRNPSYEPAAKALEEVGRKITAVLNENADPAKPPLRKGLNTYRAIKESAETKARAQVADAISEAQTVLLRSPDDGDHFTRIASALESNKVLLRSALLWLGHLLRLA